MIKDGRWFILLAASVFPLVGQTTTYVLPPAGCVHITNCIIYGPAESFSLWEEVGANGQSWQMAEWGSWTYAPDYLPTGDTLFETGVPNNNGAYSDANNDHLIVNTLHARTPAQFDVAMYNWQNYLAPQLPVVYEPDAPTLLETIKGLHIGVQNSALNITPEEWFYR